jgi:uncharacterized damage-inducible protein DinB
MGEYMLWADKKIWTIVQTLTDEEFSRVVYDRSGSIQERYLHMTHGHSQWYFRWTKIEPKQTTLENLTREELFGYLNNMNNKIIDLIQRHNIDTIQNPFQSQDIHLHLEEMLFNIINHATYHRGQIVTLLRLLGKDVVMTDYVPYLLETSGIQTN